jgi:Uma2 family endonuclease
MNKQILVEIPPTFQVTEEQFELLASFNRDLRMERNFNGELIIMPPTGGNTGKRNIDLGYQIQAWNRQYKLGEVFDSSTAFRLPNGAEKSPDVSWVKKESWESLTAEEKDGFPPLCPDFVVELRSRTDNMANLRTKMQEYLENGISLGWLIDPKDKLVEIYRPDREVEILQSPKSLSGEDILPEFILDLELIFT